MTYSQSARSSLRNVCRTHPESVIRRFGRAALLADTEHGAFLALRLREKHLDDIQVERTEPFNEFRDVRTAVRDAARAYERRSNPSTPYAKFAVDSPHPDPGDLKRTEL